MRLSSEGPRDAPSPSSIEDSASTVRAAMSDAEIYAELKRVAVRQLKRHGNPTTLNATQLVHDAFLRLSRDGATTAVASKAHLLNLVSLVMRQLICDYARNRLMRDKHVSHGISAGLLEEISGAEMDEARSFLELDACLRKLEAKSPDQANVVTCRFFAGLGEEETAAALGLSLRSVQRLWSDARVWLKREMNA